MNSRNPPTRKSAWRLTVVVRAWGLKGTNFHSCMLKQFQVKGMPLARIILLFALSVAYAILRYGAFAPKNLGNLPVFIMNKGVSMAAALCFAWAFWLQWRRLRGQQQGDDPAIWFRAGMVGAVAHVPMSLTILRPGYFPEFFAGERLSFNGEAVFLFGSLVAGSIYLLARSTWTPLQRWWLSLIFITVLFCHTLTMGLARGININRSHAYLPPMWLLSLIGIALGAGFLLMSRPAPPPDNRSHPAEDNEPSRDPSAERSEPPT